MYPNSNIEQEANGKIKSLANKNRFLDAQINDHDKYQLYDGTIVGFKKADHNQKIEDRDFSVPVQIKGHIDRKNIRNKEFVNEQVNLNDLRVYFNEGGVFYFHVYMDKNLENEEIYYCQLHQSKIKGYLDRAAKKGFKKSVSVTFNKLKKSSDELLALLRQFAHDSAKMTVKIAENTIKIDDIAKCQVFNFTAFGTTNELDILKKIANGDICLFVPQGEILALPLEWKTGGVIKAGKPMNLPVFVNGKKFYDKCQIELTSEEKIFIILSENVRFSFYSQETIVNFSINSDLDSLYRDSQFMLALIGSDRFSIGDHEIIFNNPRMSRDLEEKVRYFNDIGTALAMLNFHVPGKYKDLPLVDRNALTRLANISIGAFNNQLTGTIHTTRLSFGGRVIPILIIKNNDKITLADQIYGNYQSYIAVEGETEEHYASPTFSNVNAEDLANLYRYDFECFYEQIDRAEINQITSEPLNMTVLTLISAYDICGKADFLRVADYLAKKIELIEHQIIYIINILQIKKRLEPLDADDILALMKIPDTDPQIAFGKYTLLEDKKKAQTFFGRMSEAEQANYRTYPIYTLFEKL